MQPIEPLVDGTNAEVREASMSPQRRAANPEMVEKNFIILAVLFVAFDLNTEHCSKVVVDGSGEWSRPS